MRTVTIDLTNIESPLAMHIYIAHLLGFPDYYGRNLDALYDELTSIAKPVRIRLICEDAEGEKAKVFGRFKRVFEDAAGENGAIQLE